MAADLPGTPSVDIHYSALPTEAGAKDISVWHTWKNKCFRMEMLIWWTILGVGVGIAIGLGFYRANLSQLAIEIIGYPGELLIRALQEIVLPLIVFALMVGILNLRHNPGSMGRIVQWSLFYYLLSMLLAVGVGIALVELIQPGKHTSFSNDGPGSCAGTNSTDSESKASKSVADSLLSIGRDLIPTNIVEAAAFPNYLGVIMFSTIFASVISTMGVQAEPFIHIIEFCNNVVMKLILYVIAFTPIGVASLIASTILKACDLGGLVKALGLFMGTVLGGILVHGVVILPLTMILLSRQNPLTAVKAFLPSLVMGLGTSSSAATMPVTMQNAEDLGCDSSIVQFVIPLGTNINRDGSALYEAVSVIFILQVHGIALTTGNIVVVVITSTLAAIGCASIPNSALVTMITVLQALNYPEFIPDVAILYAVDWFLGMIRTSLNIWGDACAVVIVNNWAKLYAKKHDILPVVESGSSPSLLLPANKDPEVPDHACADGRV